MPLPSRQSYKQSRSGILAAPGRSMDTGTTGQKKLWQSRYRDCAPAADYAVLKTASCLSFSKRKIAPYYTVAIAAPDRGEYRQAAEAVAEAVIRSVELIVQPDAKNGIGEMRVCGDLPQSWHRRSRQRTTRSTYIDR